MYVNEIGSEFDIDGTRIDKDAITVFDLLKDYETIFCDSGRSAIKLLVKEKKIRKVLMPSYICESVVNSFDGCEVHFYDLSSNLSPIKEELEKKLDYEFDAIYLCYFNGYIYDEDILNIIKDKKKEKNFIIIEDTTHSFFTEISTIGDYHVCSLRKWFPIPDGGVLYFKSKTFAHYEINESTSWSDKKRLLMVEKHRYLLGDSVDKNELLSNFRELDEEIDNQKEVHKMSIFSLETLKSIDIKRMCEIRRNNARYLMNNLKLSHIESFCVDIEKGQVPLFFTLHCTDRNGLRRHLTYNKIFCPIHWPLFNKIECFASSKYNEDNELSIPIDQRYNNKDMEYICKCIKEYYGGISYDSIDQNK